MQLQHLDRGWAARHGVASLSAIVALTLLAPAIAVGDSSSELTSDQVAAEILRVQAKADETATRWAEEHAESENLAELISAVQGDVAQSAVQYQKLENLLTQIVVDRFTGRSGGAFLILGGNEVESMQRDALRALAIDNGAAGLDDIDAVRSDFERDQAELDALFEENAAVLDALATSQADMEAQLNELVALRDRLKEKEVQRAYEAQLAVKRREVERKAAEEAARALAEQSAASLGSRGSPNPSAAPRTTTDVATNSLWRCPINGPNAFGDTWGASRPGGRRHQGVDMMSPHGTPIVAVVAGSVRMHTSERGGNLVTLMGVDGNRYFYGHLSAWEGSDRSVSAGEVIGYVGATGQTTANHLHFEIHPGGGSAVNPYATVRRYC